MSPTICPQCGISFEPRDKRQRYCSRKCVSAYGRQVLARMQAEGHDPAHGGKAAQARRESLVRRRAAGELLGRAAVKAKREGRPVKPHDPNPPVVVQEEDEETAWAERGRYWEGVADESPASSPPRRRRRGTEPKPLVLNGHGVNLRVHQGSLVIRNGFTHYPQERQELRLFPRDRRLPSRIIVLDGDGSISLDVIAWLSQQRIPLVLLDWQGKVVSVVGDGAAYDLAIREAQIAAKTNDTGLRIATQLIRDKIVQSQATLRAFRKMPGREVALHKLEAVLEELQTLPASVQELQLIEARGALAYFTCWQSLPLRWKGTGRKPIPPEWERVGTRQSFFGGNNRNATHPVNAMLNYAYGVLESQVRIAALQHGLDPTIGYLHACRPGRVALVYDLMESLRPEVDRLVLDFVRSHTFAPSDFILTTRGVCRLHPRLVRQVAQLGPSGMAVQGVVSRFMVQLGT